MSICDTVSIAIRPWPVPWAMLCCSGVTMCSQALKWAMEWSSRILLHGNIKYDIVHIKWISVPRRLAHGLPPLSGFIFMDVLSTPGVWCTANHWGHSLYMLLMPIIFCLNLVSCWSNLFFIVLCSILFYTHTVYMALIFFFFLLFWTQSDTPSWTDMLISVASGEAERVNHKVWVAVAWVNKCLNSSPKRLYRFSADILRVQFSLALPQPEFRLVTEGLQLPHAFKDQEPWCCLLSNRWTFQSSLSCSSLLGPLNFCSSLCVLYVFSMCILFLFIFSQSTACLFTLLAMSLGMSKTVNGVLSLQFVPFYPHCRCLCPVVLVSSWWLWLCLLCDREL